MSDVSSDSDDEEYVPEGDVPSSGSDVSEAEEGRSMPVRSSARNKKLSDRRPSRTRSRQGGIQIEGVAEVGGADSDHSDSEDGEGGEGGEVKEEENKKNRLDDLWSSFKQDTGFTSRPAKPHPPGSQGKGSECSETLTINKTYDFAGESIIVERKVSSDSKEGKVFLQTQSQLVADESHTKSEGPALAGSKRASGLSSVLQTISSKKPKLSTLEKSKLDWDKYVKEAGLREELAQNNKDGYLEKQDFLHRSDVRQFELEKEERLKRLRRPH